MPLILHPPSYWFTLEVVHHQQHMFKTTEVILHLVKSMLFRASNSLIVYNVKVRSNVVKKVFFKDICIHL